MHTLTGSDARAMPLPPYPLPIWQVTLATCTTYHLHNREERVFNNISKRHSPDSNPKTSEWRTSNTKSQSFKTANSLAAIIIPKGGGGGIFFVRTSREIYSFHSN